MNIQAYLASINVTDVFIFLYLFAFFILGFAQGSIRRLFGIGSIVFAFFVAAQVQVPLGQFLGDSWKQFPPVYGAMIGFGVVFIALVVIFSIVIQGTYHRAEVFADFPVVEEIIGGLLGVLQGLLILMFVTIILDQFFKLTTYPTDPDELPFLRDFWVSITTSGTGVFLHDTLIPRFVATCALALPDAIRLMYGAG